jgi:hypothetical protein
MPPQLPETLRQDPVMRDVYLIVWLYDAGSIGFKEHRDLLERVVDHLAAVRDHELDDYQTLMEQREDENKTLEDEPPELPGDE